MKINVFTFISLMLLSTLSFAGNWGALTYGKNNWGVDVKFAPIADFSITPTGGNAPLTVTVDASASSDSDGTITGYAWSTSNNQNASGKTASLSFKDPGSYTVTLTVTDNDAKTATRTSNVTVSKKIDGAPVAEFSATPLSGPAPLTVTLDASSSKDSNSDGSITDYQWNSSNGLSASGKTASMLFKNAGRFSITLTVTNQAKLKDSRNVTVEVGKSDEAGYINGRVYDACTGEAFQDTDVQFDGPDARPVQTNKLGIYSQKLAVGTYEAKVVAKGYKDSKNSAISISKNTTHFADIPVLPTAGKCSDDNETAVSSKAIIIAGGGATVLGRYNDIWPATVELADKAYKAFDKQGFSSQQIRYYTATADASDLQHTVVINNVPVPVVTGIANATALEDAITQWAGDVDDVVLYIVSHGSQQSVLLSDNTTLEARQLKQWLDRLQSKIKGRVTVILEACYSGSFVPPLANSQFKRSVISSASADQTAVVSARGAKSFSYFFWDEVVFTGKLQEAYRNARNATGAQILVGTQAQKAVLDVNGDGVESTEDYTAIQRYCFGQCAKHAGLAPEIIAVTPQDSLNGQTQATLTLQTRGSVPKKAWVVLQRPDSRFPEKSAIGALPQVDLSCQGDTCQGVYDNFNVNGDYRLSFYAQNQDGDVSVPRTVELKQSGVDAKAGNADSIYQPRNNLLSIQDVEVAGGQHYWVELQDQGGYSFAIKDYLRLPQGNSSNPARFADGLLTLPRLYLYNDRYYRVQLQDSGGLVFKPILPVQAVE